MSRDEVLVVGAGPVGLVMAAELARHGIKCRIIDKTPFHAKDSRAAGIHARTLEVFEDMGVLPSFLKNGVKVVGISIYSGEKRLIHGKYQGFDTPHCFILDIPQSETELFLIHHLESLGVKVERGSELESFELHESHVDVMIKGENRGAVPNEYAYIVGCDGARSTCRHLAEIPFPGTEYPSYWVVFDARVVIPFDAKEINLFLGKEGIVAMFPLPKQRMRVTFEMKVKEPPTATYELALKVLKERVSPDIEIHEPADISPFILHHRQAAAYRKGRLFLAGDAAHIHSPAGGQGMNTGIQDAYNLAWKLALVMKGKSSDAILDTYHIERHPIAKNVLSTTDKMTKTVTTKSAALSMLRDIAMTLAGSIDSLKHHMLMQLSQLYFHYKPNAIIKEETKDSPPKGVTIGGRAPDHTLLQNGKEIRLFDLFKGVEHTLLLFAGKGASKEDLEALSAFTSFKNTYIIHRNPSDLPNTLVDQEPSAHSHYGIEKPTTILVRPDGYIGFIQEPPNKKQFENYLKKVFKG